MERSDYDRLKKFGENSARLRDLLSSLSTSELKRDWLDCVSEDQLAEIIVDGMSGDEVLEALASFDGTPEYEEANKPKPVLCGGVTDPAAEKRAYERAMMQGLGE